MPLGMKRKQIIRLEQILSFVEHIEENGKIVAYDVQYMPIGEENPEDVILRINNESPVWQVWKLRFIQENSLYTHVIKVEWPEMQPKLYLVRFEN
ncbi:hypothetical protein M0R19_05285 [Candidatus Pacearchaeota archaeon]|jgi:hypothetical protein|nr:hypothetical protein [Candidatus Pacearchaeota archaeon]